MKYINFAEFRKRLRDAQSLKYEKIGLLKNTKSIAWLMPIEPKPNVNVLQYVATTTLNHQVGYWIDQLIKASKTRGSNVALGIVGAGSEHICYLVVDENLVN